MKQKDIDYRLQLANNFERAVFLKGDEVYARETARYQWAKANLLGKKVLEIGCSSGYGVQFLPNDIEYTGVDYDRTIVDVANQQDWGDNYKFINADINHFPLEQYDTIIAFEVIEHLDNGLELAERLKKHCKRLLITCPWMEPPGFWGEHHKLHGLNESHFNGFDFHYIDEFGAITEQRKPIHEGNRFNLMIARWDKRDRVLCSIATRGRYFTTLPMVIEAIINQTRKVDKLIIFDDNDEPQDMRQHFLYGHLFHILDTKQIPWEWLFAGKKGQHHIHQAANEMGYEWVWRIDDDAIPEPNVLENLCKHIADDVGAIGGSVFTQPCSTDAVQATGLIENIWNEPNLQWGSINEVKDVDHLHCTFLYRAAIHDFNVGLSRVAHREETLFTYGLKCKGYRVLAVPDAVTWHLKNPQGGIRAETNAALYDHDERIFRNILAYKDKTVVVLNCGKGDHIVFSHVLPYVKNPEIFTCYPDVVPGRSIAEAVDLFGDIECYNIYGKMDKWKWTSSLEGAFRKMYVR